MPRTFVDTLVAVAVSLLAIIAPVGAGACQQKALKALEKHHPPGYRVYERLPDKTSFFFWMQCENLQLDLATAVHESVHMLTSEYDAYPLLDGQHLLRVEAHRDLYPPRAIARYFDPTNDYVSTYIVPGTATSSEEFGFLLDELNAFTHDLSAAIALQPLARSDEYASHRDGLAALMSFVFTYVDEARRAYPRTWQKLRSPELSNTVSVLWGQAEQVMAKSCRVPNFGDQTPAFLANVCKATAQGAMGVILGRPPLCPVSCARPRLARQTG